MQLTRQKDIFINYCQNEDELKLVRYIYSENTLNTDMLIDVIGKWRWMSGINNNNQDEDDLARELVLLAKFIMENYKGLTIDEINLAIDLSLTNKLDCDIRTFNMFSPMYVSRILNAYKEYKKKSHVDIIERKTKNDYDKELNKETTPEVKMEAMIDLFRMFYKEYKEMGVINDYFNTCYNYLRRTHKINPNKELIDEAMLYGKNKSREHISSYFANAIGNEKPNREYFEKRFARNYCVQKMFDTLDLELFISGITINEFQ